MAYNSFDAFRPSESAYVNPGEYEATQRNIALQKASYLSEMDKYYTGIEEQAREFDISAGLQREELGLKATELENARVLAQQELDLRGQELSQQDRQFLQSLAFEKEQFDFSTTLQSSAFLEGVRQFNEGLAFQYAELGKKTSLAEQEQSHQETMDWLGVASTGIALWDLLS